MRRCLIFALVLLAVPASLAAQTVAILDVGIHGYYTNGTPTRVHLQASNPLATAVTLHLELRIHPKTEPNEQPSRTDTFSQVVTLQPLETRVFDVPVLIAVNGEPVLELETRSGGHQTVESRGLGSPNFDGLIVILCADDQGCRQAEETLSFGGSPDERAGKLRKFTFLPVTEAPSEWWAYSHVNSVVLARKPASLSPEQRFALEGYLRQGGHLFLVESFAENDPFLAAYRRGKPSSQPSFVGFGWLYRFSALNNDLAAFFAPKPDEDDGKQMVVPRFSPTGNTIETARQRLALNFVFPTFGWLLWWLLGYILVVGLLNFALLRKLDRREWGWVTTPAIAVLFALAIYFASSAKRPKSVELDEVAVYTMDETSPMAAVRVGLRLSSPKRKDLALNVPGDAVWLGPVGDFVGLFVGEGISFRGRATTEPGWKVGVGPPQHFDLPLLQWSFRDLDFGSVKQLPGTVRRLGPTQLVNETGQSFQDAIYVNEDLVYYLGRVAAGATVNLGAARTKSCSDAGLKWENRPMFMYQETPPSGPFSLVELVQRWGYDPHRDHENNAVFLGLSDAPVLGAEITGQPIIHTQHSVVVVSLESAP